MALVWAILVGAERIDDCDVLQAGRTRRLLGRATRALDPALHGGRSMSDDQVDQDSVDQINQDACQTITGYPPTVR